MDRIARVAIALGSNVGDRQAHLDHAVARLQAVLRNVVVSRYRETVPIGMTGPQRMFLNAVVVGDAGLSARTLLDTLLDIERERDRQRPHANAPRTLDLDLVLYGDDQIDEPGLIVPHPRFRDRLFVLEPLAELAPMMVDPVTGASVLELLARRRNAI